MINKEELEVLNKKLDLLDKNDFVYVWTENERKAVKKIIKENKRLTEVEKEHQKQMGYLESKLSCYENGED